MLYSQIRQKNITKLGQAPVVVSQQETEVNGHFGLISGSIRWKYKVGTMVGNVADGGSDHLGFLCYLKASFSKWHFDIFITLPPVGAQAHAHAPPFPQHTHKTGLHWLGISLLT